MSPVRACTGEKARLHLGPGGPHSCTIMTNSTAPEKAEMSPIGRGVEDERPPHRCNVCNAFATRVLDRDGEVTYYCDDHVPSRVQRL
jgi:hypothetical protein